MDWSRAPRLMDNPSSLPRHVPRRPQKHEPDPLPMSFTSLNRRVRASGLHFLLSVLVAAVVSLLIFWVWYPAPYSAIAGGFSLFVLLVSVDVVLGPALTAVAASPTKPLPELRRDLALIVLIQLAAFVYGIHTIAVARPVYLSFEIDRLRVVTANDIDPEALDAAPAELQALPWTGPKMIAAVKPTDANELLRSIDLGLAGFDLSMVPKNWRPYASSKDAAWAKARPVSVLIARYPAMREEVEKAARDTGQPLDGLRFLPLVSRHANWVGLLAAPDARLVGYVPVDGFF